MDTSSLATVKPKMISGKIVWSGGPSLRQNFDIPKSTIYFMARNPSTVGVYRKLVLSCKYFFEKLPLLVAGRIYGNTRICPKNVLKFYSQQLTCCADIDMTKLSIKILLANRLCISKYNISIFASLVVPKLYRCQKADLTILSEVIQFNDFEKCAPFLTDINLHNDQIESVMLDKIIEICPQVKNFEL
uniref:Uncharacterized protein n=1 Tax=Panagrolaimus sp. ES5 TaxID=591445 RepID=A0AC34FYU5_9BILA